MYFVYILKCADNSLYTGSTADLARRLKEHNNRKRGAKYTSGRRPVKLVYSEHFKTLRKALQREAEIKSWNRRKKVEMIKVTPFESGRR